MIILIDAYNMIKQVLRISWVSQAQRTECIGKLRRYAQRRKHRVVLVFDGGPYQWVHSEHLGDVQVVYSGIRITADQYIQQYIDEHKRSDLLLVSDDHELVMHASQYEIPSIASEGFYVLVLNNTKRTSTKQPLQSSTQAEGQTENFVDIDQLMRNASKDVTIKDVDREILAHNDLLKRAARGSKNERKLLQILKKL